MELSPVAFSGAGCSVLRGITQCCPLFREATVAIKAHRFLKTHYHSLSLLQAEAGRVASNMLCHVLFPVLLEPDRLAQKICEGTRFYAVTGSGVHDNQSEEQHKDRCNA